VTIVHLPCQAAKVKAQPARSISDESFTLSWGLKKLLSAYRSSFSIFSALMPKTNPQLQGLLA
jgi:hypothetical protein